MAATATLTTNPHVDSAASIAEGRIVLTGNYGTGSSHGDVVDFSQLSYQGLSIGSNSVAFNVIIQETPPAGTLSSGYNFVWCPGTTQANGQIQIMYTATAGNPDGEYAQGTAYNAALLAAIITFRVAFPTL